MTKQDSVHSTFMEILPGLTKFIALIGLFAVTIFGVLLQTFGTSNLLADYKEIPGLIRPNNVSIGKQDSKVTVVEFIDFQCPGCKGANPSVKTIIEEYKNEVRFVYKMNPLEGLHPYARGAAQAALAANKQGKFVDYTDKLFAYQTEPGLSSRTLEQIAKEVGLDVDKWNLDRKTIEINKEIEFDLEDGRTGKFPVFGNLTKTEPVNSTPTFVFIKDGKILYKKTYSNQDKPIPEDMREKLDGLLGKEPKPEAK